MRTIQQNKNNIVAKILKRPLKCVGQLIEGEYLYRKH